MSATDGYVVGVTKIVDHGADLARWNLVIVGDGYRAGELPKYHADVEAFLAVLRTTPPFTELFCGINVHRIDVVSTDSGADEPKDCGGSSATPRTYFDATFCSVAPGGVKLDYLLTINDALAKSVAEASVGKIHQIMAIVNSSKYGGSGGSVATCSAHLLSPRIAIHEIGHSAFELADEYGGNGTGTPAGEPFNKNVTRNVNRATNKWGDLIAATTPMPSACNPACTASSCVPPGTAPPAGVVGAFEGAIYSDCNLYRPTQRCYMRDFSPFCPVCTRVIRNVLLPFQPAESIALLTPSIAFAHVLAGFGGLGVTTHRAIVFEAVTCRSLNFDIIAGPTGGFGTPLGTAVGVTADPNLPTANARLWLSYTSSTPGSSASGSVTVRCRETLQTWVINIVADTVARPRTAVVLILDRSASMKEDAGFGTTKVQQLREAANAFISLMLPGDGIGLITFNQTAKRLMEVQDVGLPVSGAGRTAALAHISGIELDPKGATSIGDGMIKGKEMLDDAQASATPPYSVLAQLVLTDGLWNRPPDLATITGSITATTYGIGLGLPSNISVPALTVLCQGHNGVLRVTGAITAEQSMRLAKYFLQVLAGVTNAQIATDPRGLLDATAEHRIPFYVCESDYGMDCILLSPWPNVIDFELEAPDGTRISPTSGAAGANSQFVPSRYASFFRCALPVIPANADGSHVGRWYAVIRLEREQTRRDTGRSIPESYPSYYAAGRAALPYEFVVHTHSSLTFKASLTQASFNLGALAHMTAILDEYEAPLRESAQVWAEIRCPDGSSDSRILQRGAGAQFSEDYELRLPGLYQIRIRAHGETMRGSRFERENTFTAVAIPGGDIWNPAEPKPDTLCELFHCLSRGDALSAELLEKLRSLGIDLAALSRCHEASCQSIAENLEVREPQNSSVASLRQLDADSVDWLLDLIAKRVQERLR